jgi:hypothetical protein
MIRIHLLLVLLSLLQAKIEPIAELYPADDMFASPEAYGLPPTDYSGEIPPIHTPVSQVNHEGLIEE